MIEAAVDLINEKGVHGMTLAEVASRLDIVATGIAYYFRRKEQLAATCFLQSIERFQRIVDSSMALPTPFERVSNVFRSYMVLYADIREGRTPPIVHFHDAQALGDAEVNAAFLHLFRSFRTLLTDPDAPVNSIALAAQTHQILSCLFWTRRILESYETHYAPQVVESIIDILGTGIGSLEGEAPFSNDHFAVLAPDSAESAPERFLKAATELINEQGYAGASVDRISARLQVTKGSFYHHVETKHDLVIECLSRTIAIMRAVQFEASKQGGDGLRELYGGFGALIDFQMSDAGPLLALKAVVSIPHTERHALLTEFARVSNRAAMVAGRGIADKSIRPLNAHVAAELLLAIANGLAELPIWAPGISRATIDALYTRPFFAGVLRPV